MYVCMYVCMYVYAPTIEPTAPTVFTVWLQSWSGNIMKPDSQGTRQ